MTAQQTILDLLQPIQRPGLASVVEWMCDNNQYFTAAASVKSHDAWVGGLADHSLEVCQNALADWESQSRDFQTRYPRESVIIASLLHDAYKVKVYTPGPDGRPVKQAKIRKRGHGLESVRILDALGLSLTPDERMAIWWHMGKTELKETEYKPINPYEKEYNEAMSNPFCQLIQRADHLAETSSMRRQNEARKNVSIWDAQDVLFRIRNNKSPRALSAIRTEVFKHNARVFEQWSYVSPSGQTITLPDKQALLDGTRVYRQAFSVFSAPASNIVTETGVFNEDCLVVAERLIHKGMNPAVLNLADALHACGHYNLGSSAQEESICRASTLSQSLYQYYNKQWAQKAGVALRPESAYPMDTRYGGIYSPVVVFRDNMSTGFAMREEPFLTGIISVAALNFREDDHNKTDNLRYRSEDGGFTQEGTEVMRDKIRTICRIAIAHGHDSLVLGAFGCGVFRLKPELVAPLFRQVLDEQEFAHKFRLIVFAIMEGKGSSRKKVEKEGPMAPFYQEFA